MDHISIIGTIAGSLTTISFLPQVIKAHTTRHTKDLSLAMYLVFLVGVIFWLLYGFLLNELPIIIANAVMLAITLDIILLKIKYG